MLLVDVELIVQGVGSVPAPSETCLVRTRVGVAETACLIVNMEHRQIVAIAPAALVVADLSAIDQTLNRLNLNIANSIQAEALVLVVTTLRVYQYSHGVAGELVVTEPSVSTGVLQIVIHEVVAILIIHGNQRVGTQHVRQVVCVLVTQLDTLTLTMLVVKILTYLDDIHTLGVTIKHVLRVQTHGETAEVSLNDATQSTILILVTETH